MLDVEQKSVQNTNQVKRGVRKAIFRLHIYRERDVYIYLYIYVAIET
jgi:hypothetical protein